MSDYEDKCEHGMVKRFCVVEGCAHTAVGQKSANPGFQATVAESWREEGK